MSFKEGLFTGMGTQYKNISKVGLVGSFIPRRCGIATFTADVAESVGNSGLNVGVIAVSDKPGYKYSKQVKFEIDQGRLPDYEKAAEFLNSSGFDIVSVQHEYGIFGGEHGRYLLNMLRLVNVPIVTTLHTVLRDPLPDQKAVMDELLQLSERVVVMSQHAIGFLAEVHGLCVSKIDLIPHGIPEICCDGAKDFKAGLGIIGPMILTFGLLSPDKGIENMVEALPAILEVEPESMYVVLGATHPNVKSSFGEEYRQKLKRRVDELGLKKHVKFVDKFVSIEELISYLGASDIYVTPYLNPRQITSGTLAYAVGAGKAVVSTPYWYAKELLADGRGKLVPFKDPQSMSEAIVALLKDPVLKSETERKAREFGKDMKWPEVGKKYANCFERAKSDALSRLKELPAPNIVSRDKQTLFLNPRLDHLFTLSDDTGLLQHAKYAVANRSEGYCVDDNARGLVFLNLLERDGPLEPKLLNLQSTYLSFAVDALNPETHRFRNFMSFDRRWLEEQGSEDSQGRTCWTMGCMASGSRTRSYRELAGVLFRKTLPGLLTTTSPRTWAYGIIGCDEYFKQNPDDESTWDAFAELSRRLFELYQANKSVHWPWFEEKLAYCNGRMPQALCLAGLRLKNLRYVESGLESLEWLMVTQTMPEGTFAPISSLGHSKGNERREFFDQQPVEAWTSVTACLTALQVTRRKEWLQRAKLAHNWFHGGNLLRRSMVDIQTQGVFDGLEAAGVNENQGAESLLAYLCATTELRQALEISEQTRAQVALR